MAGINKNKYFLIAGQQFERLGYMNFFYEISFLEWATSKSSDPLFTQPVRS